VYLLTTAGLVLGAETEEAVIVTSLFMTGWPSNE